MKRPLAAALTFVAVFTTSPVISEDKTNSSPNISGAWSGTWRDCKSGHQGPLQASLCRIDETSYRAIFGGRFWGVVPFRYTVILHVVAQTGGHVQLAGSHCVGFSGEFCYKATVSECNFHAEFTSKRYNGRFEMAR